VHSQFSSDLQCKALPWREFLSKYFLMSASTLDIAFPRSVSHISPKPYMQSPYQWYRNRGKLILKYPSYTLSSRASCHKTREHVSDYLLSSQPVGKESEIVVRRNIRPVVAFWALCWRMLAKCQNPMPWFRFVPMYLFIAGISCRSRSKIMDCMTYM